MVVCCSVAEQAIFARILMKELFAYLQNQCSQCQYRGERPKNLGLHIALVHGQLDVFLEDEDLVSGKRNKFLSQPKKQNIGPTCPICDLVFTKSQNRWAKCFIFFREQLADTLFLFICYAPSNQGALYLVFSSPREEESTQILEFGLGCPHLFS
jgi:hypothetical protein